MTLPIDRDALEYALRQLTPCQFRALRLHVQGHSFEKISQEIVRHVGIVGTGTAWLIVCQAQRRVKSAYEYYLKLDECGRAA